MRHLNSRTWLANPAYFFAIALGGCEIVASAEPREVGVSSLIGVWSLEGPDCRHGNTINFQTDGEVQYTENMTGLWSLQGNRVVMVLREFELGEKRPTSVMATNLDIEKLGERSFYATFAESGAEVTGYRCKPKPE